MDGPGKAAASRGGNGSGRAGRWRAFAGALTLTLTVWGCAQNPVTGRNELLLVSEEWELSVGRQQYAPLRQSQGGDYVVDPGVEAYVREVGQRLAAESDRKLPYEFNVINDSTPNAWALPGGKISINRGLLVELEDEAQLAAVLGHEIVHAAAKHGARGQTRGIGLQLAVITATVVGAREGYGQLAQIGSTVGAQIINSRYGRDAELESDRYGMEYMSRAGYDPAGAVELQRTFVRLSEGRNPGWLSGLFASHPPSPARVAANIRTAAALPRGGESGRDRYRRAMARLFDKREAYETFDRAQKLAAEGNATAAAKLAREAIRLEPREGHFQSFLGDLALERRRYEEAERFYDRAISLNDDFFYYWLQRGKANEAQRDARAARADYERSVRLMPTADAQAGLGAIAEARGDERGATRWYAAAAQASGPAGERARAALERLAPERSGAPATAPGRERARAPDPRDPDELRRLVQVRAGLSRQGTLAFELVNPTSRPVGNVLIAVTLEPGARTRRQAVREVLPPGGRRVIDTGRAVSRAQLKRVRVAVVNAEVAARRR